MLYISLALAWAIVGGFTPAASIAHNVFVAAGALLHIRVISATRPEYVGGARDLRGDIGGDRHFLHISTAGSASATCHSHWSRLHLARLER